MKRIFCYVAPFLLALSGMARGAGPDCAAASTARAHLVCEDKQLSDDDTRMTKTYAAALRRLSSEGARILRENQSDWSRYVDSVCPMIAAPAKRSEALQCMIAAYAQRARDLQQAAVRKGPFLFSRVDLYSTAVLPVPADQYETGVARRHTAYPRIDRPATQQVLLWNARMVRKEDFATDCGLGDGDTDTDYMIGFTGKNIISVNWYQGIYCHGTPHGYGNGSVQTLVLSPTLHPLAPGDLFRHDAAWANRITDLLLAAARKESELSLDDRSLLDHIAEVARNPGRWQITPDGIGFKFDPYELGSYIPAPYVLVPWSQLRDVMVAHPLVVQSLRHG